MVNVLRPWASRAAPWACRGCPDGPAPPWRAASPAPPTSTWPGPAASSSQTSGSTPRAATWGTRGTRPPSAEPRSWGAGCGRSPGRRRLQTCWPAPASDTTRPTLATEHCVRPSSHSATAASLVLAALLRANVDFPSPSLPAASILNPAAVLASFSCRLVDADPFSALPDRIPLFNVISTSFRYLLVTVYFKVTTEALWTSRVNGPSFPFVR